MADLVLNNKCIFISAGGTGGHVFPATSLAKVLQEQGYKIVFITDKRQESFVSLNCDVEIIDVVSLSGGLIKKIRGLYYLVRSMLQLKKIFSRYNPDLVVTFGGYTSFPTLLMAKIKDIKIILHEQNSVLGKVNRIMAEVANKVALGFEETLKIEEKYKDKLVYVGNPVRPEIKNFCNIAFPENDLEFNILVIGGSQGAKIFSRIIPKAMLMLSLEDKKIVNIVQQCRKEDVEQVKKTYLRINVKAEVSSFFDNMGERFAKAHLVISRAGASTIAELTVVGRAALLVPYKIASDNHQLYNARFLGSKNAAFIIEEDNFDPEILFKYVSNFIKNKDSLKIMAQNAAKLSIVDSDLKMAELVSAEISK